jgi:hypothetical protein
MIDYQKIANVFTYLHNRQQESGKASQIKGILFNHSDLQYNRDYVWYTEGAVCFYEKVLSDFAFETMEPYLVKSGYIKEH